MQKITDNSGIYLLEISVNSEFYIDRFDFSFKTGYYYYTGSAQRNLISRVERHYRKNKKLHWHIDYITANPNSSIINTWIFLLQPRNFECTLNTKLIKNGLSVPIKGFGNSDCSNCSSHLLYSPFKIKIKSMPEQAMVLLNDKFRKKILNKSANTL